MHNTNKLINPLKPAETCKYNVRPCFRLQQESAR